MVSAGRAHKLPAVHGNLNSGAQSTQRTTVGWDGHSARILRFKVYLCIIPLNSTIKKFMARYTCRAHMFAIMGSYGVLAQSFIRKMAVGQGDQR